MFCCISDMEKEEKKPVLPDDEEEDEWEDEAEAEAGATCVLLAVEWLEGEAGGTGALVLDVDGVMWPEHEPG
jgi:hypothetical protein